VRRLSVHDFEDKHLTWLNNVLALAQDATLKDWLQDIVDGKLCVYELDGGIIGLYLHRGYVWVEFFAGSNLYEARHEILQAVKDLAGKPVEGLVVNAALARCLKQLGFKAQGTFMRLENGGRQSE
jgi:hypothetical protein